MDIRDTHPDYRKNKDTWQQLKDQIHGEKAVKAKGELYLPFPVSLPKDIADTEDFRRQYDIYLFGAHFVNFTSQSVADLVANVFSRNPIVADDFPDTLEYLNLADTARALCSTVVTYGVGLLLVDYPPTDGSVSKAEQDAQNIAAYYTVYEPLDVINWASVRVGGVKKLSRLVIKEEIVVDNEYETQYREMSILSGNYTIQLYDEDGAPKGAAITPLGGGAALSSIPAIFTGVVTNDTDLDPSPIQGIADTNMKHYQNTAELQHAINYIGHPMLSITGAPMGFIDMMNEPDANGNKKRITVGASQALVIEGETGAAELLQISADLVHFNQLEQLEKSMGEQGYRIKSEKAGVESGTAMTIRNSGSTSKLASIATQVENAIQSSMEFINIYMNESVDPEFQFQLVKDYIKAIPDAQLMTVLNGFVNGGRLPDYVLYDYLVEVELVDEETDYDVLREDSEVLDIGLEFGDVDPATGGVKPVPGEADAK